MGFLKKFHPYVVIADALLVFVFPVFFNKTLTNFSDTYAIAPWSAHPPAGWFHSNTIDASRSIFSIHPISSTARFCVKTRVLSGILT